MAHPGKRRCPAIYSRIYNYRDNCEVSLLEKCGFAISKRKDMRKIVLTETLLLSTTGNWSHLQLSYTNVHFQQSVACYGFARIKNNVWSNNTLLCSLIDSKQDFKPDSCTKSVKVNYLGTNPVGCTAQLGTRMSVVYRRNICVSLLLLYEETKFLRGCGNELSLLCVCVQCMEEEWEIIQSNTQQKYNWGLIMREENLLHEKGEGFLC